MYAFIVLSDYNAFTASSKANQIEEFLRIVGTPSLKSNSLELNSFHSVSGFYVKIQDGWAVRYKSQIFAYNNDNKDDKILSDAMAGLLIKSVD